MGDMSMQLLRWQIKASFWAEHSRGLEVSDLLVCDQILAWKVYPLDE